VGSDDTSTKKKGCEEMKTQSIVLLTVMLVLVSTMAALPLVPVQAKATKTPYKGIGIPQPPTGDPKIWEPNGREHTRRFQRDFLAFLWTDLAAADAWDFDATDDMLTGIHRTTWITNQYYDEDEVGIGTLVSKEQLLPTAYYNEATDTYSGWWEGTSQGKTWHGDAPFGVFGEMYFAFKGVMHGKGVFKGMKLMVTVSVANAMASGGFEVQGVILDTT
jgi:hypothetical protein